MSTNINHFCPNCGSPTDPNQRFCSNCGSAIDVTTVNPNSTEFKSGSSAQDLAAFPAEQETGPAHVSGSAVPIPPPPPDVFQSANSYNQIAQTPPTPYQVVPDFARPQKGATGKSGTKMIITILVLVVILGAIGGTVYYLRGKSNPASKSTGQVTDHDTSTSPTDTTSAPTPSAVTTSSAGTVTFSPALSFVYADVLVSVLDVKQAPSFSDDPSIYGSPGVLRLDLKEASQAIDGGYYSYSYSAFTLVKADGTTISESSSQTSAAMTAGVARTNWLDFTTNGNVDVSKLTLRVGAAGTETQIDVPLQNHADLSKYQPKTYNINKTAPSPYGYVTWTITKVTVSYSALGSQAKKGKVYVTIASRLDNNSSNNSYSSVGSNMRLKSGDTSSSNEKDTLPGSVNAGQTNVTGNTTFEMPQGSTNFTCTVLSDGYGATDTSIQFQLS